MTQGWNMLKIGGTMVYSTCSLSIRQNEENVAWFLGTYKDAVKMKKIPSFVQDMKEATIKQQHTDEALQTEIGTYCKRFDPMTSHTSGFFVACFIKMQ